MRPSSSSDGLLYGVVVRTNEGARISNCHGIHRRIELTNNTTNASALGFIGSGIKCVDEAVVEHSYVHETQGSGIWCDEECNDTSLNAFHVNFNVVVNAGREGIRWEKVGAESSAGETLIEHNEVHGNGKLETCSGIGARDVQKALIRENVFGAKTIASVAYSKNGWGAIRASDSGRSDRPDLFNVDIVNNTLGEEIIKGCELPDTVVACSGNAPWRGALAESTSLLQRQASCGCRCRPPLLRGQRAPRGSRSTMLVARRSANCVSAD